MKKISLLSIAMLLPANMLFSMEKPSKFIVPEMLTSTQKMAWQDMNNLVEQGGYWSIKPLNWQAIFEILDEGVITVDLYRVFSKFKINFFYDFERHGELNLQGIPLLLYAVRKNNIKVTRILLEKYNADPNISDYKTGTTPLMIACRNNNYSMAELLFNFGADPYQKDNSGKSSFDYASPVLQQRLNETEQVARAA